MGCPMIHPTTTQKGICIVNEASPIETLKWMMNWQKELMFPVSIVDGQKE